MDILPSDIIWSETKILFNLNVRWWIHTQKNRLLIHVKSTGISFYSQFSYWFWIKPNSVCFKNQSENGIIVNSPTLLQIIQICENWKNSSKNERIPLWNINILMKFSRKTQCIAHKKRRELSDSLWKNNFFLRNNYITPWEMGALVIIATGCRANTAVSLWEIGASSNQISGIS